MKRLITITSPEMFKMLHQGFLIGATERTEKKTLTDCRLEAKILDKFDEISEPTEDKLPTGDTVLTYTSGNLELTVTEHELLKKYLESVQWTTHAVREALKLINLVENAEETPDIKPVN